MAYKQDPELWFDTGFVVLVADDETAFRIPKYLLTRVSPVFASMFEDAHSDEADDGCPVVRLQHDSSSDLKHFLRFLTDGNESLSANWKNSNRYPFSTVAAIIRIAHKYGATEIVEAAYSRIVETLKDRVRPLLECWPDIAEGIEFEPENSFEFVNLSRLIKKPLLPEALFLCCTCGPTKLRNGVARADGYVERLSDEDFEQCMNTIPRLSEAYRKTIVDTYDVTRAKTFSSCRFGNLDDRCKKRVQALLEAHLKAWAEQGIRTTLEAMIANDGLLEEGLCSNCSGCLFSWGRDLCQDARSYQRYFS